jgi:hypothetical protein
MSLITTKQASQLPDDRQTRPLHFLDFQKRNGQKEERLVDRRQAIITTKQSININGIHPTHQKREAFLLHPCKKLQPIDHNKYCNPGSKIVLSWYAICLLSACIVVSSISFLSLPKNPLMISPLLFKNPQKVTTRNAKASKVFGNVVLGEEIESSLSYTPSPSLKQTIHETQPFDTSSPTPTVLFGANLAQKKQLDPSDIFGVVGDKENTSENTPLKRDNETALVAIKDNSAANKRKEELQRLRSSSPFRLDLVRKTQIAINMATQSVNQSLNASKSVNQSLNASKKAKENVLQERSKQTKKVRFQWKEEVVDGKAFNESTEKQRREILGLKRELSSNHFKQKARKDQVEKFQHLAQVEQNYQFNSDVYRDHQQKLKEEDEKHRRQSEAARAKIRYNNREGEERLKTIKCEEEAAIIEVRHDLHLAKREATTRNAADSRKDFQFRGDDSRRIRDLQSQWKTEEHRSDHESFELKQQAEKDVENYKKNMDDDRRKSLANRNREARKIREEESMRVVAAMNAEHETFESKWAGEKDTEEYRKRMNEERRKSFASRNKESARHAEVMKELRTLSMEQETESFMLKWAGDSDAKAYLAKLAEEKRKSLQFRGKESKRGRNYDDEQHGKQVKEVLEEGQVQSDCKYF